MKQVQEHEIQKIFMSKILMINNLILLFSFIVMEISIFKNNIYRHINISKDIVSRNNSKNNYLTNQNKM